jgi:hypothetical protein
MPTASDTILRDEELLKRLNRLSLSRSFIPQVDIDWDANTTDAEYESLYSSWSLLEGSGLDVSFDARDRTEFVKYQQINLMIFTALLERYGITAIAKLYDAHPSEAYNEYIGHFIKEELYHYAMFKRAVARIRSTMPGRRPWDDRGLHRMMRWIFRLLNALPGKKLRRTVTFILLHFAEQISVYAHQTVHGKISRSKSLIRQVWGYHAIDESRHIAFDRIVLEQNRLFWPWAWIPRLIATPCCALLSTRLNANEIRAARQLGAPVHLWHLPRLILRTKARFKRRVFRLLAENRGEDSTVEEERSYE